MPRRVVNRDRKEAGIFVVLITQFDAAPQSKGRQPHTCPVEEIFRLSQCDPRAIGRICRVGHDVSPERLHEGDARILAAASAIRPSLVIDLRLQRDAKPLHAHRLTGFIEAHARNSDARVISLRYETWE